MNILHSEHSDFHTLELFMIVTSRCKLTLLTGNFNQNNVKDRLFTGVKECTEHVKSCPL